MGDEELSAIGLRSSWARRAFDILVETLDSDSAEESILGGAQFRKLWRRGAVGGGALAGYVVTTNQRVLIAAQNVGAVIFKNQFCETSPLEEIESLDVTPTGGPLAWDLAIETLRWGYRMRMGTEQAACSVYAAISNARASLNTEVAASIVSAGAADQPPASLADEIRKLSALRDQGVLTEEEFNAAKRLLMEG